ncbi:MAG: hypothetical protein FWG08_03330 [Propionibacteriaceae bacterium]|nr:hypothetical protein [Propionibacteriaceae bacterium]
MTDQLVDSELPSTEELPRRRSLAVRILAVVAGFSMVVYFAHALMGPLFLPGIEQEQLEELATLPPAIILDPVVRAAALHVDGAIDEALEVLSWDRRDDLSFDDIAPEYQRDLLDPTMRTWYDGVVDKIRAVEPAVFPYDEWGLSLFLGDPNPIWSVYADHPELDYSFIGIPPDGSQDIQIFYSLPSDNDLWAREAYPDLDAVRGEVVGFLAVADRIISRMPEDLSTYDKYRYLAYVLSLLTDYAYYALNDDGSFNGEFPVTGTAYGALMNREAVCAGYSFAYLVLCRLAGLWCNTVVGDVFFDDPQQHQWNIVQLDSGTFFVDVTWSDGSGYIGDDEWMYYFMMDQETILFDHRPDDVEATGSAESLLR